ERIGQFVDDGLGSSLGDIHAVKRADHQIDAVVLERGEISVQRRGGAVGHRQHPHLLCRLKALVGDRYGHVNVDVATGQSDGALGIALERHLDGLDAGRILETGGKNLRRCTGNHSEPQLSRLFTRVLDEILSVFQGAPYWTATAAGSVLTMATSSKLDKGIGVGTVYCAVPAEVEKKPSV